MQEITLFRIICRPTKPDENYEDESFSTKNPRIGILFM